MCVVISHTHLPARHTCRPVQYEGPRGPFLEGHRRAAAWPCSGPDVRSCKAHTATVLTHVIRRLEIEINEFKTMTK